jgi:hypothetical protein
VSKSFRSLSLIRRSKLARVRNHSSAAAPHCFVRLAGQFQFRWRLLALIKQPVKWNFECPCIFLQRLNAWNRVAVLDAGCIRANEPRPFLNVALTEILGFAEFSESLTYHHAVRLQPSEVPPQGHIARNDAIESRSHACKSLANIWFPRPQWRFRCAAFLSPAEELLASAAVPLLYGASGEAVGISGGPARLLGSRPPVLEAILDAVGMGDRSRAASLRAVSAACASMAALAPHMGETKFVRWRVKGSQLPLRWDDALSRFSSGPF